MRGARQDYANHRVNPAAGGAKVVIVSLEDSDSLDSTALDALLESEQKLAGGGCTLIVARVKQDILDTLGRSGPRGLSLQSRSYFSVADAFDRARQVTAD